MRIRRLAAKFKPVLFLKCLKWDMYVVLYVQFIEKKEIAVVFTKCHNSTFSVNPLRKNLLKEEEPSGSSCSKAMIINPNSTFALIILCQVICYYICNRLDRIRLVFFIGKPAYLHMTEDID